MRAIVPFAAALLLVPALASAGGDTVEASAFCAWTKKDFTVIVVPPAASPLLVWNEDPFDTLPHYIPEDVPAWATFAPRNVRPLPDGAGAAWDSSYAVAAAEAVKAWEPAMRAWAAERAGAAHLAEVTIDVRIAGPGFDAAALSRADVVVVFSPTLGFPYAGLTVQDCQSTVPECGASGCTLITGSVIAMSTALALSYTQNDVYNIVLHEFGHALGLQHIDEPEGDNMNSVYGYWPGVLSTPRECVSTLALEQLALSFAWIAGAPWTNDPPNAVLPSAEYRMVC